MIIFTSDETGLIKKIDANNGQVIKKWGVQEVGQSVVSLKVFQNLIFALHQTNSITILSQDLVSLSQQKLQFTQGAPLSLHIRAVESDIQILIAFTNGIIGSLNYSPESNSFTNQTLLSNSNGKLNAVSLYNGKLLQVWSGQAPSVLDINTHDIIWKAKNVRNDIYDLQVQMDDADGLFLDENTILVITMRKTIRLYDFNTDRSQPIREIDISKYNRYALKQCILSKCDKYLFVANLKGEVIVFLKNENMKVAGKLKGTQGSIRDMVIDDTSNFIATVSADRYLRIYEVPTFKVVQQHNIGQRLSSIQFSSNQTEPIEQQEIEEKQWTVYTGNEARQRFKYMRKHTIKLKYLETMFENQKDKKVKMIAFDKEKAIERQIFLDKQQEQYEKEQEQYEREQEGDYYHEDHKERSQSRDINRYLKKTEVKTRIDKGKKQNLVNKPEKKIKK